MIAAEFTEVTLIDEAITELQMELADLYERRKSILHPAAKRGAGKHHIDFSSIDMNLDRPIPQNK